MLNVVHVLHYPQIKYQDGFNYYKNEANKKTNNNYWSSDIIRKTYGDR